MTDTNAPAAPAVDKWAFVEEAVESTSLATVKKPTGLDEIPKPIQAMLEKALIAASVMSIKFPDEKMAREATKFFKAYALVREATAVIPATEKGVTPVREKDVTHTGPVVVRAVPQKDPTVIYFTVKPPMTPTPKALTAAQALAKADAATAPGTETPPVVDAAAAAAAAAVETENIRQAEAAIKANAKAPVSAARGRK